MITHRLVTVKDYQVNHTLQEGDIKLICTSLITKSLTQGYLSKAIERSPYTLQ